jgi:hypothetical protein
VTLSASLTQFIFLESEEERIGKHLVVDGSSQCSSLHLFGLFADSEEFTLKAYHQVHSKLASEYHGYSSFRFILKFLYPYFGFQYPHCLFVIASLTYGLSSGYYFVSQIEFSCSCLDSSASHLCLSCLVAPTHQRYPG